MLINGECTGKTLAYLPAICSLVEMKVEDNTESGCGPIAIIICSSSQKVSKLADYCKRFVSKLVNVVQSYGLDRNKDTLIKLLNGCDIMLTTPSFLNRLITNNSHALHTKRLQQIVFDDIDVMMNNFSTDIHKILKTFNTTSGGGSSKQLIVTSKIWRSYLKTFFKQSKNTVFVIGAYIEASVYAKSNFNLTLQSKDKKIINVLGESL